MKNILIIFWLCLNIHSFGQNKNELNLFSESLNFENMKLVDNSSKLIGYNKGAITIIDLNTRNVVYETSLPSKWSRMISSDKSDEVYFIIPSENLNYVGKVSYLIYDGKGYSLVDVPLIDSFSFINMNLIDLDKNKLLLASNSTLDKEGKSISSDLTFYSVQYSGKTFDIKEVSTMMSSSISKISNKSWTHRVKNILYDEINNAVFILTSNYPKDNSYYFSVLNLNTSSGSINFFKELILESTNGEFELSLSENRQNVLITSDRMFPRSWNVCTESLTTIDTEFNYSISKYNYSNGVQFVMYQYPVFEIRQNNKVVGEYTLKGGSHYAYMKDFDISSNGKIYLCASLEYTGPNSVFSIWEGDFDSKLTTITTNEKNRDCYIFGNETETPSNLESQNIDNELNDLDKNNLYGRVKSIDITVHNKTGYDTEGIKIAFNTKGNIEEIRTDGSHDDEVSEFEYRFRPQEFTNEKLYMDLFGYQRQTFEVDGYHAGRPSSGTDKVIYKYDASNRIERIENYCNQSSLVYGKDKEVCQTIYFYYDDHGNLIKKESSSGKGERVKNIEYSWENGKMESKIVYSGVVEGADYNYKYEIIDDVIHEYRLGQGSYKSFRTIEIKKGSDGLIVGKTITTYYHDYKTKGNKIRSIRTYQYKYNDEYISEIIQVDEHYKESEFSYYHMDKSETTIIYIQRDNFGNILEVSKVLESDEKRVVQQYQYKYDDNGNWIERTNLMPNPREAKIERVIQYY